MRMASTAPPSHFGSTLSISANPATSARKKVTTNTVTVTRAPNTWCPAWAGRSLNRMGRCSSSQTTYFPPRVIGFRRNRNRSRSKAGCRPPPAPASRSSVQRGSRPPRARARPGRPRTRGMGHRSRPPRPRDRRSVGIGSMSGRSASFSGPSGPQRRGRSPSLRLNAWNDPPPRRRPAPARCGTASGPARHRRTRPGARANSRRHPGSGG